MSSVRKVLCLIVVLCVGVEVCGQRYAQMELPKAYNDPEAYAVYSLLLKNHFKREKQQAIPLVILDRPVYDSYVKDAENCVSADQTLRNRYQSAFQDYRELNKTRWILQKLFQSETSVEFVREWELSAFFGKDVIDGWKAFYKKYPRSHGYVDLSVVGFNTEKTLAVVYMGHHCDWICGDGGFRFFERVKGEWREEQPKKYCGWVS